MNMAEYALWQGSEYAWSKFHRVLNKPQVLNMPGFRIWQSLQRVLNVPEYALISQYAWICLNNTEYDWIYQYILGKTAEYS